ICPDVWDYDSLQTPLLFDVQDANGKTVRAVGHGNKSGLYFVYEARTGKVLAQSPHVGDYSLPHLFPTAKGVKVCPGDLGGLEFSPPAYSPTTHLAYEPGLNECQIYKLAPQSENNLHAPGAADFGGTPLTYAVHGTQYLAVTTGGAAVANILGGKVGGTLAVFKLNGKPIRTAQFPAATTASSLTGGVQAPISTKGLTKINPWMFDD